MAALGSQSNASSYEQLLHVDRDGGGNTTTHVSVKDGANGTTFGFTIASDALMMTSTNRLEFGDTGTYIHQSADGVLDLVSDTEIEINATTIDMNGALDLSGNAQLSGTVTVGADGSGTDVIFYSGTAGDNFSWDASEEKLTITGTNGQTALDVADGNLVVADNVDIEGDIDVNGTTNLDAVDIDGAVQIDAAVTVGADDQGYDFKFFGDTASAYMMWDTSVDDLVFAGAAGIDLDGDIDVNGTANLDNTDIDGTLAVDGTTISLDATTSLNIDNSNTSNGITIGTATSGVPISIGHTTSETTVNDNLVITGNIDANGESNFQGDITTQSKVLIAASGQGIFGAADGNTGIRWEGSDVLAFDTEGTERFYLDANGTITIDQNENQKSLVIDSEGTTTNVFTIEADASTTGAGAYIYSNSSSTGTRNLLEVQNDHASASGTTALKIKQDADQKSITIHSAATTNHVIRIDGPLTTTGTCLLIDDVDALTTGNMAKFHSNSSTTNTRELVRIHNDNTSATGAKALSVVQDAAAVSVSIEQGGDATALLIDANSTSANIVNIDADPTTTGNVFNITADNLTTGKGFKIVSDSDNASERYLIYAQNDNTSADDAICIYSQNDGNDFAYEGKCTESAFGTSVAQFEAERAANSAFQFLTTVSGHGGSPDTEHNLRGNGETLADGAYSSSGADYAEYFESKDGKAIAIGKTVKLDGDKIVACEDGDTPIGVVRPRSNSVVIGNSAPFKWTEKYLKDDYGAYIKEEYTVTEWMEYTEEIKTKAVEAVEAKDAVLYVEEDEIPEDKKVGDIKEDAIEAVEAKAAVYEHKDIQYHTDKIPSDVTVPNDATVTSTEKDGTKLMRRKLNPEYDESKTYTPREERDEWCLIGLLGQIAITKGQPMASNWIKMKDVSNTVEMYFVK